MALQDLFGIGKGYSQVWQGNKGLEMLAQQDFAARKKKQQDDAELQAEVAKINYDGAKNEDVPHLIDSYSNIKKKYAEYRQATNPKDRIKLYTEIQDEKANFGQRLALSKQNVQLDGEYGKLAITKSDEIADDYHDKFKRFKSLSSFDPERIKLGEDLLKNGLKPKFDEDKYFNEKSKMYVEKVEAGTPRIVKSPFGQQSVVYDGEKFNAQGFANQVLNDLKNDRGMRATVAKMYPPTDDPKEIAKNQIDYANRLANLGVKQHVVTDKVTGSRNDPSWIEIERLNLARQNAANKGNGQDASQVIIGPKAFRRENKKDPMKQGDVTLEFTSYGAVNPMDFDSSQLESIYDITAGKNTNAVAFKGGSITGVGYARAKGGTPRLMATLVDKDGFESAIDYKDIPLKQREDKFFKAVVGRLKKPQSVQAKTAPNPQNRPEKTPTFKGVPKGGF